MRAATKDGVFRAIGLMSGTSLDGIDAALLETDGETVAIPGPARTIAYAPATGQMLRRALMVAKTLSRGAPVPPDIAQAEALLTQAHAEAVESLLDAAQRMASDIDYLGFHGQTILHRPQERWTWQIGDGAALARLTGIAVVNQFRLADVAAGGQGAPLVPLYHQLLARALARPVAVVNIGGVANVTYIGEDDMLMAFDTGPGNAPLDDWALIHTGKPLDEDGRLARSGRVNEAVLARLLANPVLARKPPKSLDRLDFPWDPVNGLPPAEGAATLTAFTAAAIARAAEHFPKRPRAWILCGGGRRNPALVAELAARLGESVMPAEAVGWRGDFLEAEAFAYLAVRSVKGLPLSLPATTGVPHPMTGGILNRP